MRSQLRSCAALSLCLLTLAAWSAAPAGVIELGRKGQLAGGSTFRVIIDGQAFDPNSHVLGEPVESIRDKVIAKINAGGVYAATVFDPNNLSAMTILKGSGEPTTLEVFIDDPNIGGAFVDSGASPGFSATVRGADAIAGNGNFELDITVVGNGMPPTLTTQVVSTVGMTTRDQANAAMVAALTGNGFSVIGPTNGPWVITQPNSRIQKTEMKRTDTGIHISGVKQDSSVPASAAGSIPTLSEWGLIALMVLLAGVAVTLLRRRAGGIV